MRSVIDILHRTFAVIAGAALTLMLFVAILDIVMRAIGLPIPGTYEIIGWLAATSMGAALAYTQAHKGHVAIDLVITRLPHKLRLVLEAVTTLFSVALFAAATWQLFLYAHSLYESGSVSETLRIPVYPWVYVLATGLGVLTLVLAREFVAAASCLITGSNNDSRAPAAAEATEH